MDTPDDIKREKWIDKHLFRCGTCAYKKKGRCDKFTSPCYEEVVCNDSSCDEYMPEKGLYL